MKVGREHIRKNVSDGRRGSECTKQDRIYKTNGEEPRKTHTHTHTQTHTHTHTHTQERKREERKIKDKERNKREKIQVLISQKMQVINRCQR